MGPNLFAMLLLLFCILLSISNAVLLHSLREAAKLIDRYDAFAQEYGGIEMAFAQARKEQILALLTGSAIAVSGCSGTPKGTSEVSTGIPIVRERSASDLEGAESPAHLNAAAASMLLDLHGIEVAEDDLYLSVSVASSADEVAEAINQHTPLDKVAVSISESNLLYLPSPALVWLDGTPVVFIYADEGEVQAWEVADGGLEAPTKYGYSDFARKYDESGRKAVYLTERGYQPIT